MKDVCIVCNRDVTDMPFIDGNSIGADWNVMCPECFRDTFADRFTDTNFLRIMEQRSKLA